MSINRKFINKRIKKSEYPRLGIYSFINYSKIIIRYNYLCGSNSYKEVYFLN